MEKKNYISFGEINNFVLFGGGVFLLEALRFLKKNKKNILVITSKRHYNSKFSNKKFSKILKEKKVNYIVARSLNNKKLEKVLKKAGKNKIGISFSAEWIFNKRQIKIFKNKLINIHGSLLPNFRGGGGISWPIMMKNFLSGTTAHLVDEKIDTGKIIFQKKFVYPKNIQSSLIKMTSYANNKHSKLIASLLYRIVKNKKFSIKLIDKNNSTYFPRLKTNIHGWINWDWKVQYISSFINAFSKPFKGASTYINKKKIRILKASFKKINLKTHPFQHGLIFLIRGKKPHILCDSGVLQVKLAKTESGKIFKNFKVGERLHTPYTKLDLAKNTRVFFKT